MARRITFFFVKADNSRLPAPRHNPPAPPSPARGTALGKRCVVLLMGGALAVIAGLHLGEWPWGGLAFLAVFSVGLLMSGIWTSDARLNDVFNGLDFLDLLEAVFNAILQKCRRSKPLEMALPITNCNSRTPLCCSPSSTIRMI